MSKFCELHPEWCIPVSSASGAHSAYVGQIRQKAKLMACVIPSKELENKNNLLSCELSIEKFVEEVTTYFDKLWAHHLIAKSQGDFWRIWKKIKRKWTDNPFRLC